MLRVHVVVSGRVQGVFYRDSCRREAARLGVSGWVRNAADGTVVAELEGEPAAVDALVEWCRRGPSHAGVEGVDVRPVRPTGERGFQVR